MILHNVIYRWSKIAKHLPGRTDNEIKNYWRTRIQKHLKQAESSTSTTTTTSRQMSSPDQNNHDQICASQMSTASASTPSTHYISSSNNQNDPPYLPSISSSSYPHLDHHHQAMEATSYNIVPPQMHPVTNDHFWPTPDEDLWAMQLFNSYN